MEALQANITATCPLPFAGATGSLFARAIATVVAAHCAIFNDYSWPRDRAPEITGRVGDVVSYDFIIVGAGTAGSLLAGRLAKLYPSLSVLLVEAGGDPGLDSEIPAFLFLGQDSAIDWHYYTHTDGKSCLGFKNNSCIWSKGKALGGSNSINAMLYIRGHPNDFNIWEEAGNPGWGYDNLRLYFDKIENNLNLSDYKYPEHPWYGLIEDAWKELGFISNKKNIEEAIVGMRSTKMLTKNGKRLNTAKLYLEDSKNLHIMKNTIVQKVIIDPETKIATGIEILHVSGIVMVISATKEVILSAGSIATPQILMLSGIGPKVHLENNKIKCLRDLPVGQNLQDHAILPLFLKTNQNTIIPPEVITLLFMQYILTRTGPFTNIGITDLMGFIDTENLGFPSIQYHHTYFTKKDNFLLKPYLEGLGYKKEIIDFIEKLNEDSDLLGIYPTLLHPKSRGEILLSDNDPTSMPIIKVKYFEHPDDLNIFIRAIEFVKRLQNTTIFSSLQVELVKVDITNCSKYTEEYWDCYIRHMATTVYHPVGTTKMGAKSDETTVVDHELRVHGVNKLRVVDAGVMPTITGGNTMAPTLVIAEKAVDIIKNQYGYKDEL